MLRRSTMNDEIRGAIPENMETPDGPPQGSTPPHPPSPRFTKVGFFGTPPSGADGGRKSGDTPETPSGAAPLHPASKKPTPVKQPSPLRYSDPRCSVYRRGSPS